jgi:hypothetical protein
LIVVHDALQGAKKFEEGIVRRVGEKAVFIMVLAFGS